MQAQVINLMMDLQDELDLTYLFVAHDLSVVNQISNTVLVMYVGRVAEVGPPRTLFTAPKHPYTAALLASLPNPDPTQHSERVIPKGRSRQTQPIRPAAATSTPRCPFAEQRCIDETPLLRPIGPDQYVACHRAEEIELVV